MNARLPGSALSPAEREYWPTHKFIVSLELRDGGEVLLPVECARSVEAYLAAFRHAEERGLDVAKFTATDVTERLTKSEINGHLYMP